MNKVRGFGLIEVLISVFISSLIITLLSQIYLQTKRHYLKAQTQLEEQFDIHWISDLLSNSIRRAGFTPCLPLDLLQVRDSRDVLRKVVALRVENHPRQSIQVNRMSEDFVQIHTTSNSNRLSVQGRVPFTKQNTLIIADCEHAELFDIATFVQNKTSATITLKHPLHFTYNKPTYLGEWIAEEWFITTNTQGDPSLHYKLSKAEELSPSLYSLQTTLHKQGEKVLVQVELGLLQGSTKQLKVFVRG